jgi:rhodanese-related sulfurtransferase
MSHHPRNGTTRPGHTFNALIFLLASLAVGACQGQHGQHGADDPDYTKIVKTVDADTIRAWDREGKPYILLDIRSEGEFDSDGHAPGAVLHPYSIYNQNPERNLAFMEEVKAEFARDATIVLLCSHAMRASQAATRMQEEAGFTNLYVFPGGYEGHHMSNYPSGEGWKAAGMPIEDF